MLFPIHLAPISNPQGSILHSACSPSLLGRMAPSKEKCILASNLVLVVAAVAYAFFSLKLPFLAIGLGLYGIAAYSALIHRLSEGAKALSKAQSLSEQVEELKGKNTLNHSTIELDQKIKEKQEILEKLRKRIDERSGVSKQLRGQIGALTKTLEDLRQKVKTG